MLLAAVTNSEPKRPRGLLQSYTKSQRGAVHRFCEAALKLTLEEYSNRLPWLQHAFENSNVKCSAFPHILLQNPLTVLTRASLVPQSFLVHFTPGLSSPAQK